MQSCSHAALEKLSRPGGHRARSELSLFIRYVMCVCVHALAWRQLLRRGGLLPLRQVGVDLLLQPVQHRPVRRLGQLVQRPRQQVRGGFVACPAAFLLTGATSAERPGGALVRPSQNDRVSRRDRGRNGHLPRETSRPRHAAPTSSDAVRGRPTNTRTRLGW
jgi:hypothetical protein